jgi:CheY-like chemotaxis protein
MAYVLVVEDEGDSRDFVARFLERAGHRVTSAENGRRALQRLLNDTPDVVVLDIRMPELDGIGLLEVLRSYLRWHTLPVVVLTAHASQPELDRARELGVFRILQKANFHLADLGAAIDDVIGGGADTLAS